MKWPTRRVMRVTRHPVLPSARRVKPRTGVDRVKDGAWDAADKVSDVVEDMIPGDSDRDGH